MSEKNLPRWIGVLLLCLFCRAALAGTDATVTQALFEAAKSGTPEQIRTLPEKGADMDAVLSHAITRKASTDTLCSPVEAGAKVKDVKVFFQVVAQEPTDFSMLSMLLDAGLDVDARDADGRTALMYASTPELAAFLVEKGADINATTPAGKWKYAKWTETDIRCFAPPYWSFEERRDIGKLHGG
ncbi:MAG: ankyrin repeat domain-containing protein [Synergistaceae bacterium]|nr:ankyrin repeat domain-containing protein [Synergistaceae bacterium]